VRLRPESQRTVRRHATTGDPWRASSRILSEIIPEWTTTTEKWSDDTAEAVAYTRAISALALTYADEDIDTLSAYYQKRYADLTDSVDSVGTGRGPVNGDLGALAKGPVALHRELDEHPHPLTLCLDGPAWVELTDRRTGVRALAAIAVLADGFDVRVVASPALQRELTRRYPRWSRVHLGLTHSRDRSLQQGHHSSDEPLEPTDPIHAAWSALDGLASASGKRRLLGALPTERGCTYADLADDPDLNIERGTIGRYVLDLESRGLVAIDRRHEHNMVRLTDLGETAVNGCLTAACELRHPNQTQLARRLTATTHESPSTVSPPRGASPSTHMAVESWLTATGDADEGYVRWIDTDDAAAIHQRFTLPATAGAVTLVDDPVEPFADGRVSYLSHHEGECLVMAQWGGPLATLGRLAGVLLSDEALTEILTPARLGEEFAKIHSGYGSLTGSPGRTLRRGQQVGWFSESEEAYTAWRERIEQVRDAHLARLGVLTDSTDSAARGELFEDLHGLIASATQLYHAAGIDLTVTIRLPDTESIATSETKRTELCDFIRHTVPKQSVYGVHSGYRMLFEDRPAKLKRRLPYDVESGASMTLTASWVVAGPTATTLQDDLAGALGSELGELRDAVADGNETAPTLTIPVRDGTTYTSIRDIVDAVADEYDVAWTSRVRRELTRFCLRSFGRDVPHRTSPYDAVTCLLRALNESPHDGWLTAVTRAAATLPCDRFQPALSPTATKLYATLLRASEPCGRQVLIERAGISASSYDRRIGTISELPRVRPTTVDGRRKWVAVTPIVAQTSPRNSRLCHRALDRPCMRAPRGRVASTAALGALTWATHRQPSSARPRDMCLQLTAAGQRHRALDRQRPDRWRRYQPPQPASPPGGPPQTATIDTQLAAIVSPRDDSSMSTSSRTAHALVNHTLADQHTQ
jgi:hypothetical protein